MKKMDLGSVVITNQSGVGRGFFDQSRLDLIHQQLCQLLDREGVQLEGIYVCPHTPGDHCSCRKPELGLLMSAAKEADFDPKASFVIGDQISDIELGTGSGRSRCWSARATARRLQRRVRLRVTISWTIWQMLLGSSRGCYIRTRRIARSESRRHMQRSSCASAGKR